jgi:hypothetical protein
MDDDDWLRMDAIVLRWLYGSIAPDITDMVMTNSHSAFSTLASITALFHDNQQALAGYLGQKFRNIVQGDKGVTTYCLEQKTPADALADVDAPVADDALVWNTIKGLDAKYRSVASPAPLLTSFPSFMNFRNMLLLQEMQPLDDHAPAPAAFYSAPPQGGPQRGAPPPPAPHSNANTWLRQLQGEEEEDRRRRARLPPCLPSPAHRTHGRVPSTCT